MIKKILSYPMRLLNIVINTKFYQAIVSNPLMAAITLVAIVVFWSFPSYDIAFVTSEMDESWNAIFLQAKEPFVNHLDLYTVGSHGEKLAFRFVPAVLLNMLQIQSKIPALLFQFFTLILFYYLLILFLNEFFQDKSKAFVFALHAAVASGMEGGVIESNERLDELLEKLGR